MKVAIKDNFGKVIEIKDKIKEIIKNTYGNIQLVFENDRILTLQKKFLNVEKISE